MPFGLFKTDVPKLTARGDLKGLVNALCYGKSTDEDKAVRWLAVQALENIGAPALDYFDAMGRPANSRQAWGINSVRGQIAWRSTDAALRRRAFECLDWAADGESYRWYVIHLALYSRDDELRQMAVDRLRHDFLKNVYYDEETRRYGGREVLLKSLAQQIDPATR